MTFVKTLHEAWGSSMRPTVAHALHVSRTPCTSANPPPLSILAFQPSPQHKSLQVESISTFIAVTSSKEQSCTGLFNRLSPLNTYGWRQSMGLQTLLAMWHTGMVCMEFLAKCPVSRAKTRRSGEGAILFRSGNSFRLGSKKLMSLSILAAQCARCLSMERRSGTEKDMRSSGCPDSFLFFLECGRTANLVGSTRQARPARGSLLSLPLALIVVNFYTIIILAASSRLRRNFVWLTQKVVKLKQHKACQVNARSRSSSRL